MSSLVHFEKLKLAAGAVLLSPFLPLLFMGEEYGETAPFPYFISHSDTELIQAVREGRRREFQHFTRQGEPPDPADAATFLKARLDPSLRRKERHGLLFDLYRELIRIRKEIQALAQLRKEQMTVWDFQEQNILMIYRCSPADRAFGLFHWGDSLAAMKTPLPSGSWTKRLDSSDSRWDGPGSLLPARVESHGEVTLTPTPQSFTLFTQEAYL
jgi:maltooligosyltrehalose trehalohydrolase